MDWSNRTQVLNKLKEHGCYVCGMRGIAQNIDKSLKNDREIFLQMVKVDGWSLKFASPLIKKRQGNCN